uniref:Uncharacterized protein n=1 Tax=Parascaris equorum TaxID=6256 RepID=A0A914RX24_PAREQ
MDVYADAIDENGTVEQFAQLADYFAARKNYSSAGKYHYKAAHYEKALDFLLLNGEDPEALKTAIECVADARDPELSRRLTDFLMGESDGIPKGLVKRGEHMKASRMLIRVANNISRFPARSSQFN